MALSYMYVPKASRDLHDKTALEFRKMNGFERCLRWLHVRNLKYVDL